jgi:S1-C subfamily serine protease
MDDLIAALADKEVGQKVTLAVLRDETERVIEVILEERPKR